MANSASNFLFYHFKPIILCFSSVAFLHASDNKEAPAAGSAVLVQKKDNGSKAPLDFTNLPRDVQRIIIGYVGSGWHKTAIAEAPANVIDLYFFKDRILTAVAANKLKPIIFGENINEDFAQDVENLLNDSVRFIMNRDLWTISPGRHQKEFGSNCWYSKNYIACEQFQSFFLKKRNMKAKDIVKCVTSTGSVVDNMPHARAYNIYRDGAISVCFSKDEKYLAVARIAGEIEIFDLSNGKVVGHIKNQTSSSIVFTPDNKNVIVGADNDFIALVDIKTGNKTIIQAAQDQTKESRISGLAFSPDGKYFCAARNASENNGQIMKFEFQQDLHNLK